MEGVTELQLDSDGLVLVVRVKFTASEGVSVTLTDEVVL